ncbi:hypothetical protein GW17_00046159 [Ensete ventricosum]|nr:hypothetical protein GW17_00046159 [Ensete ventricosum]
MRRSYARSESVEFDDNVSGSCRVWSTLRYRVVDFFGTIEGVSNQGSGGSCFVEPGWIGAACSESPLGRPEATRAPAEVEPPSERTEECDHATWALLLASNVGVMPQHGMMSQLDEVACVCKLTSAVLRCGALVPTCWLAYRSRSVRLPAAYWRGCRRLVSPLCLLYHVASPLPRCRSSTIKHTAD